MAKICSALSVALSIRMKRDDRAYEMVLTVTVDPSSRRNIVFWRKQRSDPRARRRADESKSTMDARALYRDGRAVLWIGVVESS